MREEAIRAAAAQVLEEVHYRYAGFWLIETLLSKLRISTISYAAGALVLMLGLLWFATRSFSSVCCLPLPLVTLLVCLAGVTGACGSNLYRLQTIDIKRSAEMVLLQSADTSRGSVFMRPLLGAVFALVMLWLCHGGALSGGIFPELDDLVCSPTEGVEQASHSQRTLQSPAAAASKDGVPSSNTKTTAPPPVNDLTAPSSPWPNLAKLLLWAFIAGFLDKFIPSHLQRLANGASPTAAPPSSAPLPAQPGDRGATASSAPGPAPAASQSGSGTQPLPPVAAGGPT
jgi:hypothetical protein